MKISLISIIDHLDLSESSQGYSEFYSQTLRLPFLAEIFRAEAAGLEDGNMTINEWLPTMITLCGRKVFIAGYLIKYCKDMFEEFQHYLDKTFRGHAKFKICITPSPKIITFRL